MDPVFAPMIYILGTLHMPVLHKVESLIERHRINQLPDWYWDEESREMRERGA